MFPDGIKDTFNDPKRQDVLPLGKVLVDGLRVLAQDLGHGSGNVVAQRRAGTGGIVVVVRLGGRQDVLRLVVGSRTEGGGR